MHPKDGEGIANSVYPDQTALFAKTCQSENLGSLQYLCVNDVCKGDVLFRFSKGHLMYMHLHIMFSLFLENQKTIP